MLFTNQQTHQKPTVRYILKVASMMLGAAIALTATLTACGEQENGNDAEKAAEPAVTNTPEPAVVEDVATEPTATDPAAIEPATTDIDSTEATEATESASAADDVTEQVAASTSDAPLAADAGKALYESKCKVCHEKGLLESPKFGDTAAWAPRIAQGKEVLYKHSAEGFKAMPAQATGDVSAEQVHAAVDYMVEQAS